MGLGRFCLVEILCLQEFHGGQFASAPILILQELNCKATHAVFELFSGKFGITELIGHSVESLKHVAVNILPDFTIFFAISEEKMPSSLACHHGNSFKSASVW